MAAAQVDGDMFQQRAQMNYEAALHRLYNAMPKSVSGRLAQVPFELPTPDKNIPIETGAKQIENSIEKLIAVVNEGNQKVPTTSVEKVKNMVKRFCLKSLPCVHFFLSVVKESSSVLTRSQ